MPVSGVPEDSPEVFQRAVREIRALQLRPEVLVEEVPAPRKLAPWALALSADVVTRDDEELASGRFVLLHDPAGQDGWAGTSRVVTLVRAELDPEVATDPLLGRVGWAWLEESLAGRGVTPDALSGTVTRVVSESFGGMAERPATVEVEVRGSWTPAEDDVASSMQAWTDLLCTAAGLPPLPDGVVSLPRRLT